MPAFSAVDTMACLAKNFMAPKMGGVRIIQLTMRDRNWSPVAGGAAQMTDEGDEVDQPPVLDLMLTLLLVMG
jgi:hypothetical protein